MNKNIQDHNSEVADMYLLFKDHKKWSPDSGDPLPSRPVVSGNQTCNVHLSELLSEILEPVAKEMLEAEILSSEDALQKISKVNYWIIEGKDLSDLDGLELINKKFQFREQLSSKRLDRSINKQNGGPNINVTTTTNHDFTHFSDPDDNELHDCLTALI